jgi:uncharacterized membrane protein (DUF485 family)
MADTARTVTKPEARIHKSAHEVITSRDFKMLVAKRWSVSGILLVLLFVTYYGYVIVLGSSPKVMAQKVGEVTTLGIPIGVGVIVFSFILTAFYIVWANKTYDPEVERLKGQLKPS